MGTYCYLFRRDGKYIAAIWNARGLAGVKCDLSGFRAMDIFGNPTDTDTLTKSPLYLFPKNDSADFLQKLDNLKIGLDMPVIVSNVARNANGRLYIGLKNEDESPVKVEFSCGGKSGKAELKGSEYRTVELPAESKIGEYKEKITVKLNGKTQVVPVTVFGVETIYVKGKTIRDIASKDGKLTAKIVMWFSENNTQFNYQLYVKDATNPGHQGRSEAWETDCVELFMDSDPLSLEGADPKRYNKSTLRHLWLPRNKAGKNLKVLHGRFGKTNFSGHTSKPENYFSQADSN